MNTSILLRNSKLNERFSRFLWRTPEFKRTFLSEAYSCQEAWNKRLESPLLSKVKPADFFLEIDQKFQSKSRVSAVDIDIFANCIQNESHKDELLDVLHKLRNTRETTWTLPSTHHAVVRYYLSIGDTDSLLEILNDRLNYGIFCEYFDYTILMDNFIKKKDFVSAAKVATFMMLQEELDHPLSNHLAIYSCCKYLENPDAWQVEDPEVIRLREEPKEVVKVRVRYIRNYYFDDHFDLWKPSDLVGKTLYWIGCKIDTPIGRSCQLRGAILYKKYGEIVEIIKQWKKDDKKQIVYKEVLELIQKDVPELFKDETAQEEDQAAKKIEANKDKKQEDTKNDKLEEEKNKRHAKELRLLIQELEQLDLYEGNFIHDVENEIKKAIEETAEVDIKNQEELYQIWEDKRMKILHDELTQLDKQKRLAEVEKIKQELEEKERILTFFEKEEQIELQIEKRLQMEEEMYGKDLKTQGKELKDAPYPDPFKRRHTY